MCIDRFSFARHSFKMTRLMLLLAPAQVLSIQGSQVTVNCKLYASLLYLCKTLAAYQQAEERF